MAVSSWPDVQIFKIEKDTKYLVCACDGIWDVMDNQQALDFITLGKSMKDYQQKVIAGQTDEEFDVKKFCQGAGVRWREPEEIDLIMKDTVENSEYCGLSTIVEMMFEINLAPNVSAGSGVGTDNMTCIIIEFRDKGDDKVSPPVKNKKRKVKKVEDKPKPPADANAKKSVSESPQFQAILDMLAKKKKEELEKKQANDPQSAVKAKILDALQSKLTEKAGEEKKI